jgi:ParB/RepB/Spo0J family partition protein
LTGNPRRSFDDAALQELAESIRTQGVLSPLLVRPKGPQTYEIVAGARRYRAAQLAAVGYVPVLIADLSDAQALEMSIVENLQRRDVHLHQPGTDRTTRGIEQGCLPKSESQNTVMAHDRRYRSQ